uniref:Eukaryotic translation initiation factor 5B n=1 Tax=Panagrolaimus davidi TaxID=227884 RepID=A0A914QHM2_9BILA
MASKKKKNVKKQDNWDDDDDKFEKKLKNLNVKSEDEEEEDGFSEDEAPVKSKKPAKSAFQLLAGDSDDEPSAKAPPSDDEPEREPSPEPEKVKPKPAPKKETKKKEKKKKAEEDEDIDAILAALESKDAEAGEGGKKKKKKKGKGAAKAEDENEEAVLPAAPEEASKENGETEAPVKGADVEPSPEVEETKAKKKKDKKKKKAAEEEVVEDEEEAVQDKEPSVEKPAEEGEETKAKKKKNKKKKKAGEEDVAEDKEPSKPAEEAKDKKKPNRLIAALQEAQRLREEQEAAEKRRIEEEERRFEEEEKLQAQREAEQKKRKEEDKRRKEEEIAKQKAAGTYRTPAQLKRAQQDLAKLKSSGHFILPNRETTGPAKKPIYGKKPKPRQKKVEEKSESHIPEPVSPPPVVEEKAPAPEPSPEPEILDDWEMAEVLEQKPKVEKPKSSATADQSDDDEEDEEEEESSEEETSTEEESSDEDENVEERVRSRIAKRRADALAAKSDDVLRSPVLCVLGHVDTGKTKMLDTIRRTNVQLGEAGGITQQLGATRVPAEAIIQRCGRVKGFTPEKVKIPGFLIIDTPGHESFANLRSRGSSLCDFAILVVDIMHGIEPQTLESIKLLIKRKTPFVVALNKVDRLYGYESNPQKDIYQHLKSQNMNTQLEFKERYEKIVVEFAEQGINVILAPDNKDVNEYISMVPTSAQLGDGVGNIMAYIVEHSQKYLSDRLGYIEDVDCTVMEVRSLPGLGTTIDVILVNGTLKTSDIIVLTGTDGPIVTQIRDILMPAPLREIRVKADYEHYKEIKGSQSVKILAKNLDKCVAGLPLFVCNRTDELEILKKDAHDQLQKALTSIKKKAEGVYVQASTLGSLEALLEFLKTQKIPYSNVNIGPVHKKDVQKAATMLEHNSEFACILAFDVPVDREVQQFADREGVRIFQANIIYHLEDSFLKYREELRLKRRRENEHLAVFPCKLQIMPQNIFNARNPIVCGVVVVAGQLKKGTQICVPSKDSIVLGTVSSIERNHDNVDVAKTGEEVCVKIDNTTGEAPKLYGRHFTSEDILVSRITRESIDVCKAHFRDDLSKADWQLVVELKRLLGIF